MHYHIYCNPAGFGINYQEAVNEFTKRLSAYCTATLKLDKHLPLSGKISPENHRFLQIISGPSSYSSEEFAKVIDSFQHCGQSNVHIFIGYHETECTSALSGLCENMLLTKCSLSACSLPADTLTLLFYEQLYRSYTILQGKTYHK